MSANHNQGRTVSTADRRVIVTLPLRLAALQPDARCRHWLAQAARRAADLPQHRFARLLALLDAAPPDAGLAALRLWGQTGERPDDWVTAADPVWLQAGLDKLFLHPLAFGAVEHPALQELFRDLQRALFADGELQAQAIGACGYLRGGEGFATASVPADTLGGERPDDWMPAGDAQRPYLSLSGEIQMYLHDHAFNVARERAGQPPVNALWLWGGGGVAGRVDAPRLPPVFSADPLLTGWCHLVQAEPLAWPGSFAECLDRAPHGCVVSPAGAADPAALLDELRTAWTSRRMRVLYLLFDDVTLEFRRGFAALLRRWLPGDGS